jgi:hypothetical protein
VALALLWRPPAVDGVPKKGDEMTRTSLMVLLLASFTGLSLAPARAEAPDLAGIYICDGVNAQGGAYRGFVEIVRAKDTFRVKWTFPRSGDSALGIGIVSNGVLAVSYYGSETAGVVVYKIDVGTTLVGEWTVAGVNGGVFKETLTRLPADAHMPEGLEGHPPDREPKAPVRGDHSKLIQG